MMSEMDSTDKLLSNFSVFSDMTLVAGIDNEEISVIRKIIAKSSPYFEAMLGPNFREGTEEKVRLEGVDGPTLKATIGYIYSNHISLTEDNVASILAAASSMEMVSLEQKCGQYLDVVLRKDNCLAALLLADQHNFTSLKTKALMLVCENFADISQPDILQLNGDIFVEVLKSDRIQLPETQIFDLMVEWCQQNEPERAKFVPELLKYIRLEFIPVQFLCSDVGAFYSRYGYSQLVFDECQKRLSNLQPNCLFRCSSWTPKGIYCFHSPTEIYLQKYNSEQSKLDKSACNMNLSRRDFGWVVHDNKLFIMGGKDSEGKPCADVERYEMFSWNRQTLRSMTSPRCGLSLVAVDQYIYAIGGINTSNNFTSECERFDTKASVWSKLSPLPTKSSQIIAVEFAGAIYVANGSEDRSAIYECSDLSTMWGSNNGNCYGKWTKKINIGFGVAHEAQRAERVFLAKSKEKLYVLVNDINVYTFNPRSVGLGWRTIGSFACATNMLQTICYDGEVFAVYETTEPNGKKLAKITFGKVCTIHELAEIKPGSNGLFLLLAY